MSQLNTDRETTTDCTVVVQAVCMIQRKKQNERTVFSQLSGGRKTVAFANGRRTVDPYSKF